MRVSGTESSSNIALSTRKCYRWQLCDFLASSRALSPLSSRGPGGSRRPFKTESRLFAQRPFLSRHERKPSARPGDAGAPGRRRRAGLARRRSAVLSVNSDPHHGLALHVNSDSTVRSGPGSAFSAKIGLDTDFGPPLGIRRGQMSEVARPPLCPRAISGALTGAARRLDAAADARRLGPHLSVVFNTPYALLGVTVCIFLRMCLSGPISAREVALSPSWRPFLFGSDVKSIYRDKFDAFFLGAPDLNRLHANSLTCYIRRIETIAARMNPRAGVAVDSRVSSPSGLSRWMISGSSTPSLKSRPFLIKEFYRSRKPALLIRLFVQEPLTRLLVHIQSVDDKRQQHAKSQVSAVLNQRVLPFSETSTAHPYARPCSCYKPSIWY
ncbi:hypothetical protein EVAR_36346_1 [Eumeta japonica]|uniref:Uncharacterized protein n=1 Tax=Eumeta variegata TaxID=151549 RepID=A0A4C1W8B2_EUMVA|nr:hypothetical protein EVAR_36346_1 [Eumeta japonica]